MTTESEVYRISLPQFEGPFDLLLFFIERDEIDIRNIPIAKVTDDFLQYIHQAKELNITLAGEFIVVAATLMSIKARVLIPRLPKDEEGNEIDPRQELVDRLLEYKRYKEILSEMRTLEEDRGKRFKRKFFADQFSELIGESMAEAEWESVTVYKLLKTFERVLQRQKDREAKPVHRVMRWPYTVENEGVRIMKAIHLRGRVPFINLFGKCENRVHAIVTFLSVLELLNAKKIGLIQQDDEFNSFVVCEPPTDDGDDLPDLAPSGGDPTKADELPQVQSAAQVSE